MKIMFASDIHGSELYARKTAEIFEKEQAERLVLLGDLLYHGPRNALPEGHNPQGAADILNSLSDSILAVRGNCDAEVDQLMLKFPIMADYALLMADGLNIYVSHGHIYNPQNPLPMKREDILVNGHTHIAAAEQTEGCFYLNPGSVALPKDKTGGSYMLYDTLRFKIKSLNGEVLFEHRCDS